MRFYGVALFEVLSALGFAVAAHAGAASAGSVAAPRLIAASSAQTVLPPLSPRPPIGVPAERALRSNAPLFLTLAPLTNDFVPASPDTVRYALTVVGKTGRTVRLSAVGVPEGWIVSFCSGRLCERDRARVAIPRSRVTVVEFQLVSLSGRPPAPKSVQVLGVEGSTAATAFVEQR